MTIEPGVSAGPSVVNLSGSGALTVAGTVGDTLTSVAPSASLNIRSGLYGLTGSGSIAVSGALTIGGAASLAVSGATLSGSNASVTLNNGSLFQVGTTGTPGAVTLNGGGQLAATAGSTLVGAFTLNGGSSLDLDGTASGSIAAAATATCSGSGTLLRQPRRQRRDVRQPSKAATPRARSPLNGTSTLSRRRHRSA